MCVFPKGARKKLVAFLTDASAKALTPDATLAFFTCMYIYHIYLYGLKYYKIKYSLVECHVLTENYMMNTGKEL